MSDESETENVVTSKRAPPISAAGRELLLQLVEKYKQVVECKKTDFETIGKKREAWDKISSEFSSQLSDQVRTGDQLKKTWDNLKTKAKKDVVKLRYKKMLLRKTGSGLSETSKESQVKKVKDARLSRSRQDDLEYEEQRLRLDILTSTQEYKIAKQKRKIEIMEEQHAMTMKVLEAKKIYYERTLEID